MYILLKLLHINWLSALFLWDLGFYNILHSCFQQHQHPLECPFTCSIKLN